MKQMGLSFGVSVVVAGQRQGSNNQPQLIATSTNGGFRLTGAATRILGIMPGDYVMFLNNISTIDAAILDESNENHAALVEYCTEKGLDITTPEAAVAIHKDFDEWYVAKGIQEFDTRGNQKMAKERLSKKDKMTYVAQNFDAFMAEVQASDAEGSDEIREALGREDITKEEQVEILASLVEAKDVASYTGSKCANPSGQTGSGLTINFTDSNVWAKLKADLGENADKKVRVYNLDLSDIRKAKVSDGYKLVDVSYLVLGASEDREPARIGGADTEE